MKNFSVIAIVLAVVAVGIATLGAVGVIGSDRVGNKTESFWQADYFTTTSGDTTNSVFGGGITVGTSGTGVDRINTGTCNLFTGPGITSIGVYAKQALDCQATSGGASSTPLTGVTTNDVCFLGFATTTSADAGFLKINGVNASSTPGYITANITNASSSAYTWASTATSSLRYTCYAPS